MKNINFKFITVLGVGAILLSLGACSSSGKSDTQGSITSSVNSSTNKEDSLVEDSINKLAKAINSSDFESFIDLLDEYCYEEYMASTAEKQNEYKEKFYLINKNLQDNYEENWIDSIRIRNVGQFNGLEFIEGYGEVSLGYDCLFEVHFIKENGTYVLKDGLSQLDEFLGNN